MCTSMDSDCVDSGNNTFFVFYTLLYKHVHYLLQFNFHTGFADTQRTSESDTDSSQTGIAFIIDY